MKLRLTGLFVLIFFIAGFMLPLHLEAESSPWARSSIVQLELLGILEEKNDAEDRYRAHLVREEFCELLVKFYLYVEGGSIESFGRISPFSDTNNRYVIAAHSLGLVKGLSETEFSPSSEVTREQVATMMARTLTKMELGRERGDAKAFTDDGKISAWARDAVYFCRANSIMQGLDDGSFAPKRRATKEQLIKMLANALQEFNKSPIKNLILDKTFYHYKIPSKSTAHLDYSIATSGQLKLRIGVKGEGLSSPGFHPLVAAYEVYEVIAPVLGHPRARLIALGLKQEWSESYRRFSENTYYGLNSKPQLYTLKDGEQADVTLRFNGSFIIEIVK